jgi:protocatechuate 3,4-dioxygenase beta subunit
MRYSSLALVGACGGSSSKTPDGSTGDSGPHDAPPTGGWASGGTVSMTDKATYPDPFATPPANCLLVSSTTAGPCTTATDLVREDISEGWTGIPVRFALKVVNSACAPLVGAQVRIWHTNIEGSYSGMTPSNAFCLKTQSYSGMDFFRGVAVTSAAGIVYFDTCFPGWYMGRAIHIHFQVTNTLVSQVFFPQDVITDIFANHAEYKPYGQPDRTNANDGILGGLAAADRARLICEVARMTDGAMLASKVVTVTS